MQLKSIDEENVKTKRKLGIWTIVCWFSTMFFMLLGFLGPWLLNRYIVSQVKQQIILTPNTYTTWGQIPGKSKVVLSRNFTFYQLSNELEFLYQKAKPVLIERGSYNYQEFQNLTNPIYSDDSNEVSFKMWLHFQQLEGRDPNEAVRVLNFGSLGAWYQVKNLNESTLFLQSFGMFYDSIDETIENTIYTYSVRYMILKEFNTVKLQNTFKSLFPQSGFTEDEMNNLLFDELFGWNNTHNLLWWVDAGRNGVASGAAIVLQDYFKLTDNQMEDLVEFFLTSYSLSRAVVTDIFCSNTTVQLPCDSQLLTALQWVSSCITSNPPVAAIPVMESAALVNSTVIGFPELNYWKTQIFDKIRNNSVNYQGIVFRQEWAYKMNWKNEQPGQWNKNSSALRNAGNIEFLFINGRLYDSTQDEQYIVNIRERFEISAENGTKHAQVFWEYCKFFLHQFILREAERGNNEIAGIAIFAAQDIAQGFFAVQDFLLKTLLSALYYKDIEINSQLDCHQFFQKSIPDETYETIDSICTMPEFIKWDLQSMNSLEDICEGQEDQFSIRFRNTTNFKEIDILELCTDTSHYGLAFLILKYNQMLAQHYNCTLSGTFQCSDYEIALMQWANSSITLNVPPLLTDMFNSTTTVLDWNSSLFPAPWEYYNISWTLKSLGVLTEDPQILSLQETLMLLNYQSLFSPTLLIDILILEKNANFSGITKRYFFKNPIDITSYIRHIMIFHSLGGLTQSRPVKDYIFGYIDPFVHQLKIKDPQSGGNPAYPDLLNLNDLNQTYEQSQNNQIMRVRTGKDDPTQTKFFLLSNGKPFISYNYSWFDGNQTYNDWVNPWGQEVIIEGTDSTQNSYNLNQYSEIKIFVSNFYRQGKGTSTRNFRQVSGLDCIEFKIGPSFYENITYNQENAIYFNNKYNGFINLTSIYQAPLFISKAHLLDADPFLRTGSEYRASDGRVIEANPSDDTFLLVEPYSGATLNALLNAQANFYMEPDILFQVKEPIMMPIMNLVRSGNATDETVDTLLSPLKMGLKAKDICFYVGIITGCVCFCIFLIFGYQYYMRRNGVKESLLYEDSSKDQSLIPKDDDNINR